MPGKQKRTEPVGKDTTHSGKGKGGQGAGSQRL